MLQQGMPSMSATSPYVFPFAKYGVVEDMRYRPTWYGPTAGREQPQTLAGGEGGQPLRGERGGREGSTMARLYSAPL